MPDMKQKVKPLTKQDVMETLRSRKDILARHKVKRIGLFGSFVRGEENEKSDIDLFVEFKEPSLDNFMGLSFSLERLFGRKIEILTPAGVDSIRISHIKEEIKKSIIYV